MDLLVQQWPCISTSHSWPVVLIRCRSASQFKYYRLCRRWDCALCSSFALPLRAGYPLGGRDSSFLSQPAEWWEPGTGQPKMVCYFYHSVLNLRAAPWRPVAGSSPQAAEFNPRTALPRGDGKHLASCLTTRPGCPSSMLRTPIRVFSPGQPEHRWYCW